MLPLNNSMSSLLHTVRGGTGATLTPVRACVEARHVLGTHSPIQPRVDAAKVGNLLDAYKDGKTRPERMSHP